MIPQILIIRGDKTYTLQGQEGDEMYIIYDIYNIEYVSPILVDFRAVIGFILA